MCGGGVDGNESTPAGLCSIFVRKESPPPPNTLLLLCKGGFRSSLLCTVESSARYSV